MRYLIGQSIHFIMISHFLVFNGGNCHTSNRNQSLYAHFIQNNFHWSNMIFFLICNPSSTLYFECFTVFLTIYSRFDQTTQLRQLKRKGSKRRNVKFSVL
jgi:hypothetical protein